MGNQFGGSWTEQKMDIVISYAKAYLKIMHAQRWVKTIYFDGFAGSGSIVADEEKPDDKLWSVFGIEIEKEKEEIKKGTALRVLDIAEPQPFDIYYFVEVNEEYKNELEAKVKGDYKNRNAFVVQGDCNQKLKDMASFMKKTKIIERWPL